MGVGDGWARVVRKLQRTVTAGEPMQYQWSGLNVTLHSELDEDESQLTT